MKKSLKIGALILALALLAGVVYITNLLTGYPISYFIVQHSAKNYMAEHYKNTDYTAEKPRYAIKLGGFMVDVHSPSSQDTSFTLQFDLYGDLTYNSYEVEVASGQNTAARLSHQYNELCKTILVSAKFPFDATCKASFDPAFYGTKDDTNEPGTHPERWDTHELKLDAEYDLFQLSGKYGTLLLNVTADEVTAETMETILLELRRVMETANLPFCSVELWVESREQNEWDIPTKTLHIFNFGWDDIYKEGLEERVQSALKATEDYYAC